MFKINFINFILVSALGAQILAKTPSESIDVVIHKSLNFIESEQKKENEDIYFKGEWPVEMRSYFLPALLGVGKLFARPIDEPTSFATASILNLLSGIYFEISGYQRIKPMMKNGLESIDLNYKSGDVYSYYTQVNFRGTIVRGPRAGHKYVPQFIQGLTNIPADADTTSVTYTAKYFDHIISKTADFNVPKNALDTFSQFRDIDRKAHYYNWFEGIKKSGAFLTWFIDEKSPTIPRGIFAKPDKGQRIPFNVNDVDCIVNANVLRMLTLTKNQNQARYKESCDVLNFSIENDLQKRCGIYYPNSYAIFFAISNAYTAGAMCLEISKKKSVQTILQNQDYNEGSWSNEPGIGRTDKVQSTALALIALMNYSTKENIRYDYSIKLGTEFLLSQSKMKTETEIFWPGEVFFSAVAQARNTVLWRSDVYTTALVALALTKSQNYLSRL